MNYDESRVYTALNAEELKPGSKIIVADDIATLKLKVDDETKVQTLIDIADPSVSARFIVDFSDDVGRSWLLAYLVEPPEPLKWTSLKVGDIIKCKHGMHEGVIAMVTRIDSLTTDRLPVYAGTSWLSDADLVNWEIINE